MPVMMEPRSQRETPPGRVEGVVWKFYLTLILSEACEGTIVWLPAHYGGFWAGFGALLFFAVIFGLYFIRDADPDRELKKDPINRFGMTIMRRFGSIALVAYGIVACGPIGVAIVAKKLRHPHTYPLTLITAAMFALVWAAMLYYVFYYVF